MAERGGQETPEPFSPGPSFGLEDFSNKDFIVRDFVDSLAETTAVPANRRSESNPERIRPEAAHQDV